MNTRKRISIVAVTMFLLTSVLTGSVFAQQTPPVDKPQPPAGGQAVDMVEATPQEMADTAAFWTREMRQSARPMEQPSLDVTTSLAPAIGEALRLPGFTPAGLPHPDANRIAQQEFPDEWKDLGLPEMLPDGEEAIQAPEAHPASTRPTGSTPIPRCTSTIPITPSASCTSPPQRARATALPL